MSDAYDRLLPRMEELRDLAIVAKLGEWDRSVMMPAPGGPARSRAMATLEGISHERLIDPEIGELLGELAEDDSLDQMQAAHVRVLKRYYEKATKVPPDLVRALAEERGHAYQAWTEARPANDWTILEPYLERLVKLTKEEADAIGYEVERYDALLDNYEPEMTTAEVETMFKDLVAGMKPAAEEILEKAGPRPDFLSGEYPETSQMAFCQWLVATLGFDLEKGRLDVSPHPFTIGISAGDVRQTTRTEPRLLLGSIYAAIHETGHALYEQGLPEDSAGLPAGRAPSMGMHESQSRMWENHVGRHRSFTDFILPHLKDRFSDLGPLSPEEFHRGVNHPARTLIRVEADEVTYNLHLAQRFEIEVKLFRDELEVADLPDAFNEGMEHHVGTRPDSDRNGVLQDMHWSIGAMGYYPTYTLGTLYAAALFAKATEDLGELEGDMRKGDCSRLLEWLRTKIHTRAFILPAKELGQEVLGEPLSARPFVDYLKAKYAGIYGLNF